MCFVKYLSPLCVAKNKYEMAPTSLSFFLIINLHDLFGIADVSVYSMLVILSSRLNCTQLEKGGAPHIGYPVIFIHDCAMCMDKGLLWGVGLLCSLFLPGFNSSFSAERLL
jgi:hypothetical protein